MKYAHVSEKFPTFTMRVSITHKFHTLDNGARTNPSTESILYEKLTQGQDFGAAASGVSEE